MTKIRINLKLKVKCIFGTNWKKIPNLRKKWKKIIYSKSVFSLACFSGFKRNCAKSIKKFISFIFQVKLLTYILSRNKQKYLSMYQEQGQVSRNSLPYDLNVRNYVKLTSFLRFLQKMHQIHKKVARICTNCEGKSFQETNFSDGRNCVIVFGYLTHYNVITIIVDYWKFN